MKSLLFAVLVLFSSYSYGLTFQELVEQTPNARNVTTVPCYIEKVESPVATHLCAQFTVEGIPYRAAVNPSTQEVDVIYTPKSEAFPDGQVPLDFFAYAGSI